MTLPGTGSLEDLRWTEGTVDWKVEIALIPVGGTGAIWDTDNWDESDWSSNVPDWVDVTGEVLAAHTNIGAERWSTRVRDANASITLSNDDGIFNPDFGVEQEGFPFFRSTNEDELTIILSDYRADARLQDGFEASISGRHRANTDQGWLFNIAATTADETFALRFQNDRLRFTVRTADGTFTIETTQVFVDGDEFSALAEYDPVAGEITLEVNDVIETPVPVTGLLNLAGGATRLAAYNRSRFESADRAFLGDIFGATLVDSDNELIARLDARDTDLGKGVITPGSDWEDDAGIEWVAGENLIIEQPGVVGRLALRPGRWIRLSANAQQGYVPVFTGTIDGIEEIYDQAGDNIVSNLQCTGFGALFAVENPPALENAVGGGERTDQRVTRILDEILWFEEARALDVGQHTMISSTLARSRTEEMQRAADAEGGIFFFDGDGIATFRNYDFLETSDRSVNVQYQPGSGIQGQPEVVGIKSDWEAGRVSNDIQMARDGGEAVRIQNTTSQSLYGRRSYQRFDFEVETDVQVEALADQFLLRRQYDRLSVDEATLWARTAAAAQLLFETQIGDRLRIHVITNRGWSYAVEVWVIGIRYNVSASDWTAIYRLADTNEGIATGNPGAYSDGYSDGYLIGDSSA